MFNEEFYPTPIGIVKRMIYPYVKSYKIRHSKHYTEKVRHLNDMTILEPSAGKGDILDGIKNDSISRRDKDGNLVELKENQSEKYDGIRVRDTTFLCIESEPDLQEILKSKGYKLVSTDFLSYKPDAIIDLIIMNPPFSNGDEHLLHAWEIMQNGDIVCLLNSETINNPYSERRKLLCRIIEEHGSVEELGPVFSNSERPTNVNVSLVRLKKVTEKSRFDFEFENKTREKSFDFSEETVNNAPALKDVIGNMLIQYDIVKNEFVNFMRMFEVINHYGAPLLTNPINEKVRKTPISLALAAMENSKDKKIQFNTFCSYMREEMWETVFQNLKMISSFDIESIMTNKVRQNWNEFVKEKGQMDFTKENVWSVIEMIFQNRHQILERCIVDVFDMLTKYTKENRMIIEGWKTNDCWKVNKKFILPHGVSYGSYMNTSSLKSYGDMFKINYNYRSEYSDIDKAMAYITGTRRYLSINEALENHFHYLGTVKTGDKFDNTCESTFFKIKFWKKGTIHCEFKNHKLWEQFNLRACSQKQWLPPEEEAAFQKSKQPEQPKESKQLLIEM